MTRSFEDTFSLGRENSEANYDCSMAGPSMNFFDRIDALLEEMRQSSAGRAWRRSADHQTLEGVEKCTASVLLDEVGARLLGVL
jgi:hypothetical protein